MTDAYSNGLNYVPYQSKRGSKRLSSTSADFAQLNPNPEPITPKAREPTPTATSDLPSPPRGTIPNSSSASSGLAPSSLPNESPPVSRPTFTSSSSTSSSGSTFRRLGPRASAFSQPATSSPLRPRDSVPDTALAESPELAPEPPLAASAEVPAATSSDVPRPPPKDEPVPSHQESSGPPVLPELPDVLAGPASSATLELSAPTSPSISTPDAKSLSRQLSPIPPTQALPEAIIHSPKPSTAPSPALAPVRSPIPISSPSPNPVPVPFLPSPSLTPAAATPSPPPLPASSPAPASQIRAPYRPGFQPKGAYRVLTSEFVAARDKRANPQQRGEERRIERRLEKLITLHFSDESPAPTPSSSPPSSPTSPRPNPLSLVRRSSSFFSDIGSRGPGDLFRSVVEPKPGTPAAIRAAEQVITPWQDDAAATACPHCQQSFHPITNRKHHCRLCGLVVCALPPKKPNRIRPCSLLITVDKKTGRVREVPETISYGVSKRNSTTSVPGVGDVGEKEAKNFRICRECNAIISRKEMLYEAHTATAFTRLHALLLRVESDIETSLASLQTLLPDLSFAPELTSSPEILHLRKELTTLFADYDAIAKRIRGLPVPPPPAVAAAAGKKKAVDGGKKGTDGGMTISAQERVQLAVWTRAVNFMQMHVGLMQRLPKPPTHKHSSSSVSRSQSQSGSSTPATPENEKVVIDTDAAAAHSLQPLLEQEALLESFIQEASAQRKFEDVKSLKGSLVEIRAEIARMVAASDVPGPGMKASR
ncbi:hypothetical protein DL93DRAFT_2225285 [Clavulina sp. PMI_390]|nr:hypothetical protein DL93DRAFT_2225285 [Clavulina sp. PMI_390]